MSDIVKAALIMGAAIIIATAIAVNFSPYQTCVRGAGANGAVRCAAFIGSYRSNSN